MKKPINYKKRQTLSCSAGQSVKLKSHLFLHSKAWLAAAALSMVILSAYNLAISWQLQKIIDIAAGRDHTPLAHIILVAVLTFAIFVAAYFVYRRARPGFIQTAMVSYKAAGFEKILGKKTGSLSNENTGKLISALTNDMRTVEDYYLDSILTFVDIGVSFLGALIMMLYYSPILTLVAVLLSILPVIASIPPAGKLAAAEKKVSTGNADYVELIQDLLSGFQVIKNFHAEKEIQTQFEQDNRKIENIKYYRRYAEENVNLLSTAASVIMRLGVFVTGAWMAVTGAGVTPGIVLVFLQLVSFVISPVERMPSLLANRKAAIAILDKTEDFLSGQEDGQGQHLPLTLKKGILIRDLSFGYDRAKPVLEHINLEFLPGKKYAIVGGSGSGKTTLLNLLMQTYDNYDGYIMLDGTDLRNIHPDSLFHILSLVQQNVFVFNDTVYNNITLYKDFPEDDILSAIESSGLSAFIADHGSDYICGENGHSLSGGEKQRISIARGLLHNTSVLLMDEATAALDEITAEGIMNSVLEMENITRIIVTHRLNEKALRQYDEIIVMHQGKIAERGIFDDLITRRGLFYSLFTISQS